MRNLVRSIVGLGIVCVWCGAVVLAQRGPAPPDERVIEWLRSPNASVRQGAVAYLLRETRAETRSAAVEQAMVDELMRVNAEFKRRWQMSRAGTPMSGDFPAEYHFDVIEAVSQSTNPLVISSLAGALGTGRRAQEGLAKFGEQVVPVVLPLVRQTRGTPGALDEPPPYVIADAIGALALMIERPKVTLSVQSRAAIIDAARQRLSGRQDLAVIAAACRLAVTTKDLGLRSLIQQLAQDRRHVTALGVTDEASVILIQKVAARELRR